MTDFGNDLDLLNTLFLHLPFHLEQAPIFSSATASWPVILILLKAGKAVGVGRRWQPSLARAAGFRLSRHGIITGGCASS